jgi:hypothetical protein
MEELNLIKINPSTEECKVFLNNILIADMGVSDSLKEKLEELNKDVEELSIKDLAIIKKELFWGDLTLYNLVNSNGEYFLPLIYSSLNSDPWDDNLFCFSKYGEENSFDLFTKSGKKIYENAWKFDLFGENIVIIQSQDLKECLYKYNPDKEQLIFISDLSDSYKCNCCLSENRLFIENGYVNENLEPQTPFCFDEGKDFNEGLAAVCLNGKWGYINNKGEIVVDFQYGEAYSFQNGYAQVLELKPEFQIEKGCWVEVNSFNENRKLNYSEEEFQIKFPKFPKKIKKPLSIIRGLYKTRKELINEYNCFKDGTAGHNSDFTDFNSYGTWVIIDVNGNQIDTENDEVIHLVRNSEQLFDYWFEKVKFEGNIVYQIPDELFINKEFVCKLMKEASICFNNFSCYYSDDDEVCALAFEADPTFNYSYFSERLKEFYSNDYNKLKEDEKDFFKSKSTTQNNYINLDDDLPF